MNPEWTEQEKERISREIAEEEIWEERYTLFAKELAGEEQCSCCRQSIRCEEQFANEGDCCRYEEIPYFD